jgi:diguanylate cyclase (GGDEF)-like protein/PAS domain S-box-containing protein
LNGRRLSLLGLGLLVALALASLARSPDVSVIGGLTVAAALGVLTWRVRRDRDRTASRLAAQHAVAATLARSTTLAEAAPEIMRAIGEPLGWQMGAIWRETEGSGSLGCVATWRAPGMPPNDFETLTRQTTFARGAELPGHVWDRGQALWVSDILRAPSFARARVAADAGLRGAVGFPIRGTKGTLGMIEFFAREVRRPDPELLTLLATFGRQVGERLERWGVEEAVRESEALKAAVLEAALDCVITIDHEGRIVEFNPAAERTFAYARADVLGKPMAELLVPPALREQHQRAFARYLRTGEGRVLGRRVELTGMRSDGSEFPVELAITRIGSKEPPMFAGYLRDLSERKRSEEQVQYLAAHDLLTGLFNRRRFEEELSRCVASAQRYGEGGAVLVLDLDNLKQLNDALGHEAGDELLRTVAGLLSERFEESDIVARLGSDEFAVFLPHAERTEAETVATGLVEAVRRHQVRFDGRRLGLTATVGVALLESGDARTGGELLDDADLAMYDAKEAGRSRARVYTSAMGDRIRMQARMNWPARIRHALDHDLFALYCQPIKDLRSGEISQYELLLRMIGDDGEVIPPQAFLGAAERFGLIQAIDRWVVRRAIQLLAHQNGDGLHLEVNLSGQSMGDPTLPGLIEDELGSVNVDPAHLIFEVTETAAIANMDEAAKFARRLASAGCRFALDDFGTGFGSFYYLKHLPFDYLKIDGDFIGGPRSLADELVVKAIVAVAGGLGKETIAEYVTDEETVRLLKDYGVDYGQGYHVGHPQPVWEVFPEAELAAAHS